EVICREMPQAKTVVSDHNATTLTPRDPFTIALFPATSEYREIAAHSRVANQVGVNRTKDSLFIHSQFHPSLPSAPVALARNSTVTMLDHHLMLYNAPHCMPQLAPWPEGLSHSAAVLLWRLLPAHIAAVKPAHCIYDSTEDGTSIANMLRTVPRQRDGMLLFMETNIRMKHPPDRETDSPATLAERKMRGIGKGVGEYITIGAFLSDSFKSSERFYGNTTSFVYEYARDGKIDFYLASANTSKDYRIMLHSGHVDQREGPPMVLSSTEDYINIGGGGIVLRGNLHNGYCDDSSTFHCEGMIAEGRVPFKLRKFSIYSFNT
ncbi:hypothetical protein KIPB_005971, partial [Kipferlia bialata]